jgi:SPP1 gp7 family putative phage head morphogenesis protein
LTDPTPTIRQALSLPPTDAIEAFRRRDELKISVSWRDLQPEEHARAFTVAKMAKVELLATVKESLDRALAEGKTFEMWQAEIQPELQKAGWWGMVKDRRITGTDDAVFVGERRLRTIFRTNMRVSHAAGQWERVQKAKSRRPYIRYSAVRDSRTRPQHARWNGIILPVDHPFWRTHFPPNGWNCRCGIRNLSDQDLERNGWTVTTEEELARLAPMEPVGRMPFGPRGARVDRPKLPAIDHGWDYNVGAESILGIVEKAAIVIIRARAAGLIDTAERLIAQLSIQLADDMLALLLRLIDGIEPASVQWQDEIAGARKRRRTADGDTSAETRAKLSRIAALRNRIMGRFADEAGLTGREAARLAHTRQWIADTIAPRAMQAEPLQLGRVSQRTVARIEAEGLKVHSAEVVLEHGHTRHMFSRHGGEGERRRGQEPITADDAHDLPRILNEHGSLRHVTDFKGRHRSSAPRLEISSTVDGYRHELVVEIQQKGLVPRTHWKVPLK